MSKKMTTIRVLFTGLLVLTLLALLTPTSSLPQRIQVKAPAVGNFLPTITAPKKAAAPTSKQQVIDIYGKLPLLFEANHGQTDSPVKFISRGSGYNLYLTPTEAVLSLRKEKAKAKTLIENQPATRGFAGALDLRSRLEKRSVPAETTTLRMKLVGGNEKAEVIGLEQQSAKVNYFIGNDPKKWQTDVPTYARTLYKEVYRGVDLAYHGQQRQLEYDFIVKPGADPNQIRLGFAGAKRIRIDEAGNLILTTNGGEVRQHKPVIYQEVAGSRKEIAGSYVVRADRDIGFKIGTYDLDQPLVIDPVLVYSTLLGGIGFDNLQGIAVDGAGNAYVAGYTNSSDFPTMAGAFDTSLTGGMDIFVTKLTTGATLAYTTFLGGGASDDYCFDIAVDAAGLAFVTGSTGSSDFPTTVGSFDTTYAGNRDAFVTKLDASGGSLVYSTLIGGSSVDIGYSIAIDAGGYAYITGATQSPDFPTTAGAFDTTWNSSADVIVAKLNTAGTSLVYSTFLGGISLSFEVGSGIAVDATGHAYITGQANDFPTTVGAFDTTPDPIGSALYDVFVTKLNATGSALDYSTFLGGNHQDVGYGIAIDGAGYAYVTGYTISSDFPTTAGAFDTSPTGGTDIFVTKLNTTGSALVYSTFLGGSSNDEEGRGIAVDAAGHAYVTGYTLSSDFPTTAGAFDTTLNGADVFVTKLNTLGATLAYSTLLGGSGDDLAYGGIAINGAGEAYVAGYTTSSDFPTTPGAYDSTYNESADAFVAKLSSDEPLACDGQNFNNDNVLSGCTLSNGMVGIGWIPVTSQTISKVEIFTGANGQSLNSVTNRIAIWSDDGGSASRPLASLVATAPFNVVGTNSWQGASLTTPLTVTAGQKYWVVWDFTGAQICALSPDSTATHLIYWGSDVGTVDGGADWFGPFGQTNNTATDRWKFRMLCGSECSSGLYMSGAVPDYCEGTPQPIDLSLSGGSLSGATVSWSLSGPTPNSNLGSGTNLNTTLTGLAAGNYTITATAIKPNCPNASASASFTVKPTPTVTISGAPAGLVRSGTVINLTANVSPISGALAFLWTKNGALFSTAATISDSPGLGSNSYQVTVNQGGCASSAQVNVTVSDSRTFAVVTSQVNSGLGKATVIDLSVQPPVAMAVISGLGQAFDVAITPDGTRALVTAGFGSTNTLAVINLTSSPPAVSATIPVGGTPTGVSISADGTRAVVSNNGDNTISVLDLTANPPVVIATVPVGTGLSGHPYDVVITADGTHAVVAFGDGGVGQALVIDLTQPTPMEIVSARIGIGKFPIGMRANPDRSVAVVTSIVEHNVTILDLTTYPFSKKATVAVGRNPGAKPDISQNGLAVVPNSDDDSVSIINVLSATPTVVATVPVGGGPRGATIIDSDNVALVANRDDGNISRVNLTNFTSLLVLSGIEQPNHIDIHEGPPNHAPLANAGPDQTKDERTLVTLDGSGSNDPDGDTLSFQWVQMAGPAVTLLNSTTGQPTFTAPDVPGPGATLTFQLTVSDGPAINTDPVNIVVRNINRPPVTNAGPNQTVNEGRVVTLSGSGSDPDGDTIAFHWLQILGPIVTLVGENTAAPNFTAPPAGPSGGSLRFRLTVDDGFGGIASDDVDVAVFQDTTAPVPNLASLPIVTGECSASIASTPTATDDYAGQVTGTTTDPTNYSSQGTFTIHWTYNDGNGNMSTQNQTVVVHDITAPVPNVASLPAVSGECSVTVTAPAATDNCASQVTGATADPTSYNSPGTFTIHWSYADGHGNTSTQNQTVIVQPGTTANAGPDQAFCETTMATLAGNTPTAGTGTWTVLNGTAIILDPHNPAAMATNLSYGANVFRWTFSNGSCSSADDVVITRNFCPTNITLLSNRDSFLRSGADDTNEGANERLRIQNAGDNRVVTGFDLNGISTGGLQSATLILTIAENSNNWSASGRLVDANRLLVDWTEGNGRNDVMAGAGQEFRGTGAGVTWHCGNDTNIVNQAANCSPHWNGGTYAATTAASVLHTNGLLGQVSWDVTADVLAGANFGWLIRKRNEGQNGQVRYYSREGASLAGNANLAPRLVLVYSH